MALSQRQVAAAVRSQHLSGVWTVEYALELLLLGGLIPEATWLAQSLGDWKMAVSLGLAYTTYCRLHCDFSRLLLLWLYIYQHCIRTNLCVNCEYEFCNSVGFIN